MCAFIPYYTMVSGGPTNIRWDWILILTGWFLLPAHVSATPSLQPQGPAEDVEHFDGSQQFLMEEWAVLGVTPLSFILHHYISPTITDLTAKLMINNWILEYPIFRHSLICAMVMQCQR